MIYLVIATALLLITMVVSIVMFNVDDSYTRTDWWLLAAVVSGILGAILLVFVVLTPVMRSHDETVCARQGVQLERDVRFVRYSSFQWECLTPSDGGWVSLDRVIRAETTE